MGDRAALDSVRCSWARMYAQRKTWIFGLPSVGGKLCVVIKKSIPPVYAAHRPEAWVSVRAAMPSCSSLLDCCSWERRRFCFYLEGGSCVSRLRVGRTWGMRSNQKLMLESRAVGGGYVIENSVTATSILPA